MINNNFKLYHISLKILFVFKTLLALGIFPEMMRCFFHFSSIVVIPQLFTYPITTINYN